MVKRRPFILECAFIWKNTTGKGGRGMSSLTCPECREEMLPQKDYDRKFCTSCGHDFFVPAEKLRKIYCTDCDESDSEDSVRVFKY
jgi:predicted RNA-binding Zn-ribbon protein involved in translation (DUF1610 family)